MESLIKERISGGDDCINVNLPHLGLGDEVIQSLLSSIEQTALKMERRKQTAVSLVLEMNFFTSAGLKILLERFLLWQTAPNAALSCLHLKRIRFHMNRLDDAAATHLATYMRACLSNARLPSEIHLSHNRLTSKGARDLIVCAGALYPRVLENKLCVPLWLRLEYNVVDAKATLSDVGETVRVCKGLSTGVGASFGRGRGRGGGRVGSRLHTPAKCSAGVCLVNNSFVAQRKDGSTPASTSLMNVHLPYFHEQQTHYGAKCVSLSSLVKQGSLPQQGGSSGTVEFSECLGTKKGEGGAKPTPNKNAPPLHLSPPTSTSKLYVVLDTSAVLRMSSSSSSPQHLTFSSLGFSCNNSPPPGLAQESSVVFVLLETVLQQLDNQKSKAGLGALVNVFMKLYPVLQERGALIRLLSEDAEDVVRSGGANVCTVPGCRLPQGKFDSDGMIIDCSLTLLRALGGGGGGVMLLTADIYMRNRGLEVGMPTVLLESFKGKWGGSVPFTAATFLSSLPTALVEGGGRGTSTPSAPQGSPSPTS